MPLKDLTVNTAELQEQWIEDVIESYAHYDIAEKQIVLLPAAAKLSARAKILVYLVALRGWPFVTEDEVSVSAKPGRISEELGISGGTLRPALKYLKESKYISAKGQAYSVPIPALESIKEEVARGASETRRSSGPRTAQRSASSKGPGKKSNGKSSGSSKSSKNSDFLDKQVTEGFFNEPKVLGDVVERFHENGLTVHRGTASPLLIKAVRAGELRRKKITKNNREVWAYQSIK